MKDLTKRPGKGQYDTVTIRGNAYSYRFLGEGEVDHLPLIRFLKRTGYNGYLSLECLCLHPWADLYYYAIDPNEIVKHEVENLRPLLRSA